MQGSRSKNSQHQRLKEEHRRRQSQQRSSQDYYTVSQTGRHSEYQGDNSQHQHQPQHHEHGFQLQFRNSEHQQQQHQEDRSHQQLPPPPSPSRSTSSPTEQRSGKNFGFDLSLLSPVYARPSSTYSPSFSRSPSHSSIRTMTATTMTYPSSIHVNNGLRPWDHGEADIHLSSSHQLSYSETTADSIPLTGLFSPSLPKNEGPLPTIFFERARLNPLHASHEPTDAPPAFSQQSGSCYSVPEYQQGWHHSHHESIATRSSDGDEEQEQQVRESRHREYYERPASSSAGLELNHVGGASVNFSGEDGSCIAPSEVMPAPYRHEQVENQYYQSQRQQYQHQYHSTTSLNRRPSFGSRNSNLDQEKTHRAKPYPRSNRQSVTAGMSRRGPGLSSQPRGPVTPHSPQSSQLELRRPFNCTFLFAGCTSTFASKNEWKRHVSSQHTQLTVWKCKEPSCGSKPNAVFNRKDLFSQHLKRTHMPPFTSELKHADSAMNRDMERKRKEWMANVLPRMLEAGKYDVREAPMHTTCGFCFKEFRDKGSWEARMEHVGRHYEMSGSSREDVSPNSWEMDSRLVDWAVQNGIVMRLDHGLYKLAAGGGKEAVVENTGRYPSYGRYY